MKLEDIKKAQALGEWYLKVAENKNGWKLPTGSVGVSGPDMKSCLKDYIINDPKPIKKIIDLSACIESGIDMELSDTNFTGPIRISKLCEINLNRFYKYNDSNFWQQCRVREDHWHSHDGSETCPIPEGFKIEFDYCANGLNKGIIADNYCHSGFSWKNVTRYRILRVLDTHRYEWQDE